MANESIKTLNKTLKNAQAIYMRKWTIYLIMSMMMFYISSAISPEIGGAVCEQATSCVAQKYVLELKKPAAVTHFFTHALIADAKLAFAENNKMNIHYDRDCLTVKEFKSILEELYAKDYMLVDINTIFSNGKPINFYFPKNKKPIIFSFDDINYYAQKMYQGMNDKLVLNNGRLGTLLNGEISYDNEVITILENFVEANPDFSYKNAKGIICLTGFDGILGYRTQIKSQTRQSEISKVKPIVSFLKSKGWRFASHSYGHYHMQKLELARFQEDTMSWKAEVASLIGNTNIYVYPYGENEILNESKNISAKQQFLLDNGFSLFFGVGIKPYYNFYPNTQNKVAIMDRIPLEGETLRSRKKTLAIYFDFDTVYDYENRPPIDD